MTPQEVVSSVQEEVRKDRFIFSPSELNRKEHGELLCYPGTNIESFDSRTRQLKELGVFELILEGGSKVGKYGIIGRGCVSTVVKARLDSERDIVALKIRRVDANRADMKRDYELQNIANSVGVGPKAISFSQDLFAMEYVDSTRLGKWFEALKTRTSKKYTRAIIRNVLVQCLALDLAGLDHGELSNPTKHVLIRNSSQVPATTIIDYESASTKRKVANLTAVAQFFFLAGWQSKKIWKILGLDANEDPNLWKKTFIERLRNYKQKPSKEAVDSFLDFIGC